MWLFSRLKVRSKLALLAGVPVLGALLLSLLIVRSAQREVQSARALGSIEDLASLTERIADVLHALQLERAQLAYSAGASHPNSADDTLRTKDTDQALASLESFLGQREQAKLPNQLRENLWAARRQLGSLEQHRLKFRSPDLEIRTALAYYATANDSLIGSTAALAHLSDDGELALSIIRLTGAMQVIERSSREHALLSFVFGKGEFPPGTFRDFVSLLTEEETHAGTIRTLDGDAAFARFQSVLKGPHAKKIADMRTAALEPSSDTLSVDAGAWFRTQNENVAQLFHFERELAAGVRLAASKKVAETRSAVRLSLVLVLAVCGLSGILAWAVGRSLTRSVRVLSEAAEAVQERGDFSVRAEKTSNDELGLLTDAFNAMLAGLAERDRELKAHGENLEQLVEQRTRELSERNAQMRLVLDVVDQGLVMIDRLGRLLPECSRAFAEAFGSPRPGTHFSAVLADQDGSARTALTLHYQQLIDDVLPTEVALAQMPKYLAHHGRHYTLSFMPARGHDGIAATLLVVRDVTEELAARRLEAAQRQQIRAFERAMSDRRGFLEFLGEARGLVEAIREDTFRGRDEKMRTIHTLKGNAAMFEIGELAHASHRLEQALLAGEDAEAERQAVLASWEAFVRQIAPVLERQSENGLEFREQDFQSLERLVRSQASHTAIAQFLRMLRWEPAHHRCERVAEQLRGLARRFGKGEPIVEVEAGDVRIPVPPLRAFWSAFAHVVRNVVDHGMETPSVRTGRGKDPRNRVVLRVTSTVEALCIEIRDDGAGIDWEKLAQRAKDKGLPLASRADLKRAIFAEGVSTADEVTLSSGRGVGMSALAAACSALHGSVEIESEPGRGTHLRVILPPAEKLDELSRAAPGEDAARSAPGDAIPSTGLASKPAPS